MRHIGTLEVSLYIDDTDEQVVKEYELKIKNGKTEQEIDREVLIAFKNGILDNEDVDSCFVIVVEEQDAEQD